MIINELSGSCGRSSESTTVQHLIHAIEVIKHEPSFASGDTAKHWVQKAMRLLIEDNQLLASPMILTVEPKQLEILPNEILTIILCKTKILKLI